MMKSTGEKCRVRFSLSLFLSVTMFVSETSTEPICWLFYSRPIIDSVIYAHSNYIIVSPENHPRSFMLATGAHAGSTREITACYRSPVPLINRTQHPLRRCPPRSFVRSLARSLARARVALSSAGQRSVEVRLGTRASDARRRRGVRPRACGCGITMDRLSALTQRLVPSDSFDPAGPGLAVKECWAVTSRHCQWRSRSEWNTARSSRVYSVTRLFFGGRAAWTVRCGAVVYSTLYLLSLAPVARRSRRVCVYVSRRGQTHLPPPSPLALIHSSPAGRFH